MQLTLFGEKETARYSPQRQKIIKEHLEKVEKHNQNVEKKNDISRR